MIDVSNDRKISDFLHINDKMNAFNLNHEIISYMNKVNPTTCVATSNQNVNIPDDQGRNIVLYFYPKDDTPGCTIEGNDFTRLNDSFAENNSVVYGVSRDSIASHEKFINKFNYTIDLISDEDESLCKEFDVLKLKKCTARNILVSLDLLLSLAQRVIFSSIGTKSKLMDMLRKF